MRKRATDGTKISTSLTITKKMVRTRRRADRLLNSTIQLASTEPRQKPDEASGTRGEQGRSIIASRRPLACLTARRVGHDQIGQCADLELLRDRQCPRKDQITGPGAEDRGPEYATMAAVSRSVCARSFSTKRQRSTRGARSMALEAASVNPTWASSGSV